MLFSSFYAYLLLFLYGSTSFFTKQAFQVFKNKLNQELLLPKICYIQILKASERQKHVAKCVSINLQI